MANRLLARNRCKLGPAHHAGYHRSKRFVRFTDMIDGQTITRQTDELTVCLRWWFWIPQNVPQVVKIASGTENR